MENRRNLGDKLLRREDHLKFVDQLNIRFMGKAAFRALAPQLTFRTGYWMRLNLKLLLGRA